MHEMALVRNVVDIVTEEAAKADAERVAGVYLTIGYSRDIVEDLFEGLFAWMCRDTVAEGAELFITRVPFTVRCQDCGRVYPLDVHNRETWPCPVCHRLHYTLNSGMEFYVNDIEIVPRTATDASAA